jgi:glycosyltransferase involved in cell wall biosynthesis
MTLIVAVPEPVPILLMARQLDQGGVERDLTKLALHIDRSRFTPHVATYFDHGMRFQELWDAKIPLLHLPVTSIASRSALEAVCRMSRYVRENGIKLIHAFDTTALLATIVARLTRTLVVTCQLSYREICDSRTVLTLRWSDYLTHVVQVNCKEMQRYLIENEHVSPDRVELCYNGVETAVFYPAKVSKPKALDGAGLVIGTVCALRPEKNLQLLQEAFANVRHCSSGLKLLIVGSGAELRRLRENAASLSIADASVFIPATPEVASWMRAIDIFVLPSYSEAFSNSLLEAMACGCAVVGSRVGGTPELIGENERGLLFENGDADELCAQLQNLIGDEDLRRTLSIRAAQFANEHLNLGIALERQSEIYERLLRRRNPQIAHLVAGRAPTSDLNESRGG